MNGDGSTQASFFFPSAQGSLYGTLFMPRGGATGPGFVLCSGFAKDAVIFRTQLSYFGRELAARGFPALRFDYAGYGDSDGEFAEATPSSMCGDIERAIEELHARSGCSGVGLLGLRLGATLAAVVAGRRSDVQRLILWEPLPAPWKSMMNELRMTIAMQTAHLKDVKASREQIVENILAGRPTLLEGVDFNVIHDGFPLSRGMVEQTMALDLLRQTPALSAATLVVHITENAKKPRPKELMLLTEALRRNGTECALEVAEVPMLPWVDGAHWMACSPSVFEATSRWLCGDRAD